MILNGHLRCIFVMKLFDERLDVTHNTAANSNSQNLCLCLKRLVQQRFNLLVCPLLTPPHVYTLLKQITIVLFISVVNN